MLKTVSSVANALGALNYKGTWDASTNTPALASGVGTKGDYYVVSVDGATDLDGITNWGVGDWATFNGSVWQRVEGGADGNFVNLDVTGTATFSEDASIHNLTVGRGSGSVSSNTAVGSSALQSNIDGINNTANGVNALRFNTSGSYNTASGLNALHSNISGGFNTASGASVLRSNTSGSYNSAIGFEALYSNINGNYNSASGAYALYSNIDGSRNAASGASALVSNTSGSYNSAIGFEALYFNDSGSYNSASGAGALFSNIDGSSNTSSGSSSLYSNTSGSFNTASGSGALYSNTSGSFNTASGAAALRSNIDGIYNSAYGVNALWSNTSGSYNTASGFEALFSNSTGSFNTASGVNALRSNIDGVYNTVSGLNALFSNTSGSYNSASGANALYSNDTGSNNLASGANALRSNTSGTYNSASGNEALYSNSTGYYNTASGTGALYSSIDGYFNTASGFNALYSNTFGNYNSASGARALWSNTTGVGNAASGFEALYSNDSGSFNSAFGVGAGNLITTGSKNTIIGRYNGNQGGLDIRTADNHIVLSDGDGNPRVIVDASGNVKVGSASIQIGYWEADAVHDGYLIPYNGSGQTELVNSFTTGALIFKTGTSKAERLRIDDSGNLLVNRATDIGNGYIQVSGVADTRVPVATYMGATTSQAHIYFFNPNGLVGSVSTSGSATSFNTSSDYRLKEDAVPMTGATERVKALRPINFAWKVDGSRTDGFFAHEAQEVVPECATGTKDAMREEEYEVTPAVEEVRDEDGNVITEAVPAVMGTRSVPDYQGIDQSKFVPLLTAALQEAIAKIETLEARITTLEGK